MDRPRAGRSKRGNLTKFELIGFNSIKVCVNLLLTLNWFMSRKRYILRLIIKLHQVQSAYLLLRYQ